MKLSFYAACALLAPIFHAQAASPKDMEGVRFDQHKAANGYLLVARGKPEQTIDSLRQAYLAKAQSLCDGATVSEPRQGEYQAVKGGAQFLSPAGGILIPMSAPYHLTPAPSLTGAVSCPGMNQEAEAPLRLAIDSDLGSGISYVDQGFASFNRGQIEAPVAGPTFSEIGAAALVEGLRERGYQVELVPQQTPAGTHVLIERGGTPGEFFTGVVMMTKLNMMGLDEASYAFCSMRISSQAGDGSPAKLIGQLNTREKRPAIYSNWKKQMADGPSAEINALSYGVLSRIVSDDVRAAVHAMSVEEINQLAQHP